MTDWTKARELCERATPGPWRECASEILIGDHWWRPVAHAHYRNEDDAEFIAAARTLLPAALDEIERLSDQTCARHADQKHGAEAEELRAGLERIMADPPGGDIESNDEWLAPLRRLLDRVDARDSLAYLEARDEQLAESERYRKSAEGKLDIMLDENKRVQAEFTAACREWIAERDTSTNRIARLESIAREAIDIATMSLSHLDRNAETKATRLAALLEEVDRG